MEPVQKKIFQSNTYREDLGETSSHWSFSENIDLSEQVGRRLLYLLQYVFKMVFLFQIMFATDDFWVSIAILHEDTNFVQTTMKWYDVACNVGPCTTVKNCNGLTMKLKVKYVFPTSSSGTNFLFIRCLKIWKCEKY